MYTFITKVVLDNLNTCQGLPGLPDIARTNVWKLESKYSIVIIRDRMG